MRHTILLSALLMAASPGVAAAQAPVQQPNQRQVANCPPGAGPNAPTLGRDSNQTLSDQLADSHGVICPPAGVDPDMHVQPKEGGRIEVIPPPGSRGGNPDVHPK